MRRSFKHYHLLVGMHGYIPDLNMVFIKKEDALLYSVIMKRDYVEFCSDLYRISGKKGEYTIYRKDVDNDYIVYGYIDVDICYEPECLLLAVESGEIDVDEINVDIDELRRAVECRGEIDVDEINVDIDELRRAVECDR